jgi:pyruvate dehydrogenase complex dehydrogenase (E1) component
MSDLDPTETWEWHAARDSVLQFEGTERAQYLLEVWEGTVTDLFPKQAAT